MTWGVPNLVLVLVPNLVLVLALNMVLVLELNMVLVLELNRMLVLALNLVLNLELNLVLTPVSNLPAHRTFTFYDLPVSPKSPDHRVTFHHARPSARRARGKYQGPAVA